MTTPDQTTTTSTSTSGAVINNNVTVVVAGPSAQPQPHPHPRPHPHRRHPHPQIGAAPGQPSTTAPSAAPEVRYDAQGERVTVYHGRDGSTATFIDDERHGHKITFILNDGHGKVITTHGDSRGYAAVSPDVLGMQSTSQGYTEWFGAISGDRLNCPGVGNRHITPNVNEGVTRTQLQDFFGSGQHGDLLRQIRGVSLPVTVMGGMPASLSQALSAPSDFRGCPSARRGEGIIVERIPH